MVDIIRDYLELLDNFLIVDESVCVISFQLLFFEVLMNEILFLLLPEYSFDLNRLLNSFLRPEFELILAPSFKRHQLAAISSDSFVLQGSEHKIPHSLSFPSFDSLILWGKSC